MDTFIIIAASAVGGSLATLLACGWHCGGKIARRDDEIDELRRAGKTATAMWTAQKFKADKFRKALSSALSERDEARRQLALAGNPDQPRDPITGRWMSKEAA